MRDLDDILEGSIATYQAALTEAFEMGRAVGREETRRAMRSRLDALLADDEDGGQASSEEDRPPRTVGEAVTQQIIAEAGRRAIPGSVKPVVLRLVREQDSGSSVEDVVKATGFKYNSVRGTLWALSNDGLVQKKFGLYYPVEESEAAGVEPEQAPPAASHEPPSEWGFPSSNDAQTSLGPAPRHVEPAPGGGT